MNISLFTIFVLFFIGTFCHVSIGDFASAKAVQIIAPINHTFHLELNNLKSILEADDIRDRHVAVVSIAGAFRKGKSFLSNFFLRYLYAQYKAHDVSDWLGENGNSSELSGFKWRGGQKPETIGIWMWSDIFTYDFENGEKVAIILLDTQGIFDSQLSLQDCTTIFAMSMMLSSVQCYNVMQNIQENDLQHLELFTEYGRMVLDQTNEKPFQYLLFLARDWPFADENNYGWGQEVIDRILSENEEQTLGMRQLRQRINSSFDEIGAFLMPYPGNTVALKKNFNGDLKRINPEFIRYVKELVPSIFAPENLVLKRINGEQVRARDLIEFMQAYLNVFNRNTLPEAKTFVAVCTLYYQLKKKNVCY
ncbi:atlastin-like [Sitodiplosis mosellana]|uniref:atlastin-like n=1 Tax=Sitodiplosis mosellana TaxID=263140 RepID=UPI00244431AB|nr:atlastin-like [Sitodiplosis mosellana]